MRILESFLHLYNTFGIFHVSKCWFGYMGVQWNMYEQIFYLDMMRRHQELFHPREHLAQPLVHPRLHQAYRRI